MRWDTSFLPIPTISSCAKRLLTRPLIKRQRYDSWRSLLRSNADADLRPWSARFYREVGHADVLFEKRRGRSAGDAAGFLAIANDHGIAIASNHTILHLETGENAAGSGLLLGEQSVSPEEIPFGRLANPAQIRFPNRGRVVNFVAVDAHAGFEPQGGASAQTARQAA